MPKPQPRGVNGDMNAETIDREIVELERVTDKHRATVAANRQYRWQLGADWIDEASPFLAWGMPG